MPRMSASAYPALRPTGLRGPYGRTGSAWSLRQAKRLAALPAFACTHAQKWLSRRKRGVDSAPYKAIRKGVIRLSRERKGRGSHAPAFILPPRPRPFPNSWRGLRSPRAYRARAFPLPCLAGEPVRGGGEGWFAH
jgi:hypothetical protein